MVKAHMPAGKTIRNPEAGVGPRDETSPEGHLETMHGHRENQRPNL